MTVRAGKNVVADRAVTSVRQAARNTKPRLGGGARPRKRGNIVSFGDRSTSSRNWIRIFKPLIWGNGNACPELALSRRGRRVRPEGRAMSTFCLSLPLPGLGGRQPRPVARLAR